MDKKDILRNIYEKKYLDESPQAMNSLVAPQTSGAKILRIFGFENKDDGYPMLEHKNITDIGGGLSSLAFEISSSAEKITVVDPMYHYETKEYIDKEQKRAEKRLLSTKQLQEKSQKDLIDIINVQKEIAYGIEKRKKNMSNPDPKIVLNDSLAQNIVGILADSQDIVFFNFVLDKLQGTLSKEQEILVALDNAYRITKSGGKIYGIHNKGSAEDEIINALSQTNYKRDAWYQENNTYIVFTIDKE